MAGLVEVCPRYGHFWQKIILQNRASSRVITSPIPLKFHVVAVHTMGLQTPKAFSRSPHHVLYPRHQT